MLRRTLPAVMEWAGPAEPIDLASGGIPLLAALLDRPLLPASAYPDERSPLDVAAFETSMRDGRNPAMDMPAADASGYEHIEAVILATSWARERFIAPPKAAKYVTAGVLSFCAVFAASGVYQLGLHLMSHDVLAAA